MLESFFIEFVHTVQFVSKAVNLAVTVKVLT